ncbi:hypothetical protein EMPS_08931 [Entomortierella parvispora]|uniref:Thioredoxin domain-containing protein n=1 Tax=Entomortierella parvispora TaxID=205924 RepID=A0A9P3HH87_9FUNG|nr:hypothetical protein EMPS_08931 [Entomortierella parvispora]
MKFLKSTLAFVATVALLTSPAAAQYGEEEAAAAAAQREAAKEGGGLKGLFQIGKAIVLGGTPPPIFEADPEGHIFNVTDVNYKETIFEDEWIITFCSATSAPCADYFPTFVDAAITMKNETTTKFSAVWVEDSARVAARFFVPARLPYVIYAKDGEFRQIPYQRNDTQFLVEFIEEEKYKMYPILDGPMSPYSKLSVWFEKYAEGMEWMGQYTSWMPKWMVYIMAGSLSGVVFNLFSGGSSYSSDPSRYPHLNADGTLKKPVVEEAPVTNVTKTKKSSSSTKKRSSKKVSA